MFNIDIRRYSVYIVVLLSSIIFVGCSKYPLPDGSREYVTSTVSVLENDGIVIHVLNHSDTQKTARVRIHKNTGAGATQMVDSNDTNIAPSWKWGLGYTINESGEYWVQINLDSDKLIPKVSFERNDEGIWLPIVDYTPGDFAVFDGKQRRIR